MTFGFQTVTLVKRSPSTTADDLGTYPMTEIEVDMPGCLHRPARAKAVAGAGLARAEEQPAVGVSAAVRWWQTSVPLGSYSSALRAAVLGAQASDQLRYGGDTYQIIGVPDTHPDFANPFVKVTFTSEKQTLGS